MLDATIWKQIGTVRKEACYGGFDGVLAEVIQMTFYCHRATAYAASYRRPAAGGRRRSKRPRHAHTRIRAYAWLRYLNDVAPHSGLSHS
ncbi:hypothetical protein AWB73_03112 [Caballeronia turbans]|jgi:hypothetical protein|nr:hypothetical protein AWB73_03112 [Caballeronia turbans]